MNLINTLHKHNFITYIQTLVFLSTSSTNHGNTFTYKFRVMMLAVPAVLDVVKVVAGLLAQKAEALRTGHVELLLASCKYLIL